MSIKRNIYKKYIRTFTAALFIAIKKCKRLDCSLTSRIEKQCVAYSQWNTTQ